MPFADILPWDQISVMIDFESLVAAKLNTLDVLNTQFTIRKALAMARKACLVSLYP